MVLEDVLKNSATEEQRRKDEKPSPLQPADAARLAKEVYGLDISNVSAVKELDSYDDRNFIFPDVIYQVGDTKEAMGVIFKVHNGVESDRPQLIEAHNFILQHIRAEGVEVPEPLRTKDGVSNIGWIDLPRLRQPETTRKHAVRLLRYIPGSIIGQTKSEKNELWKDVGRFVGKMDKKLLEIQDIPAPLRGRQFLWDLKNVPALASFTVYIDLPARRELQQRVIQRFNEEVFPKIPTLRQAVIQNDANEANVIVDAQRTRVAGLIDFGDCLETCIVFEIAICMAYMMLAKDDPLATAAQIYAGYIEHFTLTEAEEELLHTLVCSRLVQSVTMSAYSSSKDPTNEYLKITSKPGWALLEQLDGMPSRDFLARLKAACGAPLS